MILLDIVDLEFDLEQSPCQPRPIAPSGEQLTFFSYGRSNENFPKRTWKGEHASEPMIHVSACCGDDYFLVEYTIFLLYNNHIDCTTQCCRVDRIPGFRN